MEKRKGVSGNARVFQTSSVGWVLPDTNFATTFASTKEPQKASASHTPPLTPTLVSVASPAAPNFINFNPSAPRVITYVSLICPLQPSCYY